MIKFSSLFFDYEAIQRQHSSFQYCLFVNKNFFMPKTIENFPQSIIALLLSDYHVAFTQMQDILINDQFYTCIHVIIAD